MRSLVDKATAETIGQIALQQQLIADLIGRVAELERRLSRSVAPSQLVSEAQAAKLLGVSPQTLARFRKMSRPPIPTVYVEGIIRYRAADIEQFIQQRTRGFKLR